MADPRKPPGSDWDPTLDDAEIFVETPTVPSDIAPLPENDDDTIGVADVLPDDGELLPAMDGEIPMIAEPLPEMYAEMWQAGIQAVVMVPDQAPPVSSPPEEWAVEARRYRTESAHADGPAEAARLLLAAARAFEQAGDPDQAERVCDEALQHDPKAAEVLRVRARLAEGRGDHDAAHAFWAQLATALPSAEERAQYGALTAEWTLARSSRLPAIARQSMPQGPARFLAQAEEALRADAPGEVASNLAEAGRAMGGALGAALLEHAARCREAARDRVAAASERAEAAKLDPYAARSLPGQLRDAARADDRAARALLDELASGPEGVLSMALARWTAAVASRAGDKKHAAVLREGLAPVTAAAARDRIDQEAAAGVALDPASLQRLRAGITGAAGIAVLSWIEAGNLAHRGETNAALGVMGQVIAENPDAIPLGLLAQQIASDSKDPDAKEAAFDLWLRSDPGRRAEAALALAEARQFATSDETQLAARGALQTAIEAAPGSALFWSVAAGDARAGRQADASATLAYGAEMWGPSALGPGLRACALAHLGLGDAARAFEGLKARLAESPDVPTDPFAVEARARLAERAGDAGALAPMLAAAAAAAADPERAASLAPRRAALVDAAADAGGRARVLREALEGRHDHPAALALYLLEAAVDPGGGRRCAVARGEAAAGSAGPIARLYRLAANQGTALAGDGEAAIARASDLIAALPADRLAKRAMLRAAARVGSAERSQLRTIAQRMGDAGADSAEAGLALAVADALSDVGDVRARAAYRSLEKGRFAAEAKRALARGDDHVRPARGAGCRRGCSGRRPTMPPPRRGPR